MLVLGAAPWPKTTSISRLTRSNARAAEDVQLFQCFPAAQRAGKTAQSQNVIQMAMGQEDAIETAKAQPATQELALRALATVDHEAMLVTHHQRGREAALMEGAEADVPRKTNSNKIDAPDVWGAWNSRVTGGA